MRVRHLLCALVLCGLSAGSVAAQDAPRVGVTMGYPGAVGVLWNISDRIALRPDVTLTRTTTESTTSSSGLFPSASTTSSTGWSTAVGLSALVTLTNVERVRIYLTPRVAWSRTTSKSEAGAGSTISALEITTSGLVTSGSVGTEYRPHDRFGIFAELGLQYSDQETTSDFTGSRNRTDGTTFGVRSALGVTLFF